MLVNFTKFEGLLPYSSGLFGIFQPLLGWRAAYAKRHFGRALGEFQVPDKIVPHLLSKTFPLVRVTSVDGTNFEIDQLQVGVQSKTLRQSVPAQIDSRIARRILNKLRTSDSAPTPSTINWETYLARPTLELDLTEIRRELAPRPGAGPECREDTLRALERESMVAGVLAYLYDEAMFDVLNALFFSSASGPDLSHYQAMKALMTLGAAFDPANAIERVSLSPVGVIHLFRQYFFELDSFLGPSVQHVWLSPGAVVELVETHSRNTIVERFTETSSESIMKTEEAVTTTDEISDAIKDENTNNTKLGVSVNIDAGADMEIFSAHASANVGFGYDTTQKRAREQLHKQTRAQSSKVTNEIKRNFKTSLRTVTETTDVSSKRYVLTNNSTALVNYELRRKMRQVGVQLQDMGTQLCWQTYVDEPGRGLGVAELVHIAQPADLSSLPLPKAPVYLEPMVVDTSISFPYEKDPKSEGNGEMDVTFYNGSDGEEVGYNDLIIWQREYDAPPPQHGYSLESIQVTALHSSVCVPVPEVLDASGKFKISLTEVNFNDQSSINLAVKLTWQPPDQTALQKQYEEALADHKQKKSQEAKDAFVKAARERIRLASGIASRDSTDLREEERIVIYRNLIKRLLHVDSVDLAKPETRHLMSELVSSLFDVDKMLYFVAPEWWNPRPMPAKQSIGEAGAHSADVERITPDNVVSWGGVGEKGRDNNYYITEDSQPAKLGSSLGWLLQLDGDTMRNAFLNAPWVKAVIPIRPGMELAALEWLKSAAVEGADKLDALYQEEFAGQKNAMADVLKAHLWTDPDDLARYGASFSGGNVTIEDALRYLAIKIAEKHANSNVKGVDGSMPLDKVYDHGFNPLTGGFQATPAGPFEVFDQWVEVLPTDQLVAVQVQYDPITGMQVTPP